MRRSARALIIENGAMLGFERRRKNTQGEIVEYFSIPGGALEENETPAEALAREIKEELLIDIQLVAEVARLRATATEWYHAEEHIFFICKRLGGEPRFNEASEEGIFGRTHLNTHTPVWRPLDDLLKAPALYSLYRPAMNALLPYLKTGTVPSQPLDITA